MSTLPVPGMTPTAEEMRAARQFVERWILPQTSSPFSFVYGGRPFADAADEWQFRAAERELDDDRVEHRITYTDPLSGLAVRCVAVEYRHLSVVEWVVYLQNCGSADTPIIADIRALDAVFALAKEATARLHHARGSTESIADFAPREAPLGPGEACTLEPSHRGRSSDGALPFFSLEMGDAGVTGAIGWTGDWRADFQRDADGAITASAGMHRTHLKLLPGEEIRTPRIALLFWQGDRWRGQNLWRRFVLAHHSPMREGKPAHPPIAHALWGENTADNQIAKARWCVEHNTGIDCLWIDAGWFGDAPYDGTNTGNWALQVGNWWPHRELYPEGMAPVGKAVRDAGLDFLLWIEPERVHHNASLAREHPEWMLGPVASSDSYLFNLGVPEARQALTDLVSGMITDYHISWYRQDFNTHPAPFWEAADAPDRVGMTEIRHIEGLYAFWDELLARHPGLMIDNCSSGGRRLDLEMISRSIALWRSDFQCTPDFDRAGMQGQTQGLAPWVPLSTGCCERHTPYDFRSALGPGIVIAAGLFEREPAPASFAKWVREMVAELRAVRDCFYGDFYPLLTYSLAGDAWAAWQFNRPESGDGLVQVFRRERSPIEAARFPLRGVDADATYSIHSFASGEMIEASGADLMTAGLAVSLPEKPSATTITYSRLR